MKNSNKIKVTILIFKITAINKKNILIFWLPEHIQADSTLSQTRNSKDMIAIINIHNYYENQIWGQSEIEYSYFAEMCSTKSLSTIIIACTIFLYEYVIYIVASLFLAHHIDGVKFLWIMFRLYHEIRLSNRKSLNRNQENCNHQRL